MAPNTLLPTLAMLAAVFLWSSATPGSKFALTEIPVAEFVVIRLSLAAVGLVADRAGDADERALAPCRLAPAGHGIAGARPRHLPGFARA